MQAHGQAVGSCSPLLAAPTAPGARHPLRCLDFLLFGLQSKSWLSHMPHVAPKWLLPTLAAGSNSVLPSHLLSGVRSEGSRPTPLRWSCKGADAPIRLPYLAQSAGRLAMSRRAVVHAHTKALQPCVVAVKGAGPRVREGPGT